MNVSLKLKLQEYKPTAAAVTLVQDTPMLFVVGVFGAGKGTLIQELVRTDEYHRIVSHTTRPIRINDGQFEVDGVDYHFIDIATAEHMIDQRAFLEAKLVHESDIYGTSVAEIQMAHDEGKTALTDIDVQGVVEYMHISQKTQAVFLLPPSFEVWQERIIKRSGGKLPDEVFKRRMKTSYLELEHALASNYFHFVINDQLDRAVHAAHDIHNGETSKRRDNLSEKVALQLLADLKTQL